MILWKYKLDYQIKPLAVILDGNKGGQKNNLDDIHGYTKGFENIKNLASNDKKDIYYNLLSSENFQRSSINIIYEIIYKEFSKTFDELVHEKDVKIKIFGSRKNLPKKIIEIFEKFENISSKNKSLDLNIAFNYGFKNEIINVIKNIKNNKIINNLQNEKDIREFFYLGSTSDPDLLIRTGGYKRLSNFIMYNLTYTELFLQTQLIFLKMNLI